MNKSLARLGHFLPLPPATILLLATPLFAACTLVHSDDPSAVQSQIDEENLPGLSLAVGVAGEVVWAEGFGWADIDERLPVTPKTRFRIGSVAMPMTATAVGLLYERGLLDLDAPVRDYVRSFPGKEWPVTTRQLMGHVAGVRHYRDNEEALYRRHHCDTPLDGLELFAGDPLLFEPGTRYQYSSYGWTLVGAVVEAAAGEPFLDFMQREVLDPLQMQDTILDDPAGPVARRTSFYFPFAFAIRASASRTPTTPTTPVCRERAHSCRPQPTSCGSVSRYSKDACCAPRRSGRCGRRLSSGPGNRPDTGSAGSCARSRSDRHPSPRRCSATAVARSAERPRS